MQQLLTYFLRLCIFSADPADAPKAPAFLATVVVIHALISFTILTLGDSIPQSSMVPAIALGLTIEAVATVALLAFRRVTGRFMPTMSALLATSAVLNLLTLPVTLIAEQMNPTILALVGWISLFWWVSVAGFILHRAANLSFGQAAAFAFAVQLLYLTAVGWLVST